jgi:hypothetical protein
VFWLIIVEYWFVVNSNWSIVVHLFLFRRKINTCLLNTLLLFVLIQQMTMAKAQAGVKNNLRRLNKSIVRNGANHIVHVISFALICFLIVYLWSKMSRKWSFTGVYFKSFKCLTMIPTFVVYNSFVIYFLYNISWSKQVGYVRRKNIIWCLVVCKVVHIP